MSNTDITFPQNPTQGQQYTYGSTTYIYDGTFWSVDSTLINSPLKLDSTNNRVGINNTSPTVELDVTGAIKGSTTLQITGATTLSSNLTVDTNTLFVDATNNRVGIGTVSPVRQLHIHEPSDSANVIQITNTDTGSTQSDGVIVGMDSTDKGILWNYENTDFRFGTNDTQQMTITANGNVGIGTASPSTKLEVNGSATITGTLTAAGNTWPQVIQNHYASWTTYTASNSTRAGAVKIAALDTTITPRSASSKILVTYCLNAEANSNSVFYLIRRVNNIPTEIGSNTAEAGNRSIGWSSVPYDTDDASTMFAFSKSFLDSPNTTAAVTYELWWFTSSASLNITMNRTISDADTSGYERGTSQCTLQEYFA